MWWKWRTKLLGLAPITVFFAGVYMRARPGFIWMLFLMQNFSEVAADFREIFSEEEPPSLTQEHLNDPEFISLWFKIKLLPLLPNVSIDLLSCLSTKNFSCPVYQTMWVHWFSGYTVLIWFHTVLCFSFFSAVFHARVVWKTLAIR